MALADALRLADRLQILGPGASLSDVEKVWPSLDAPAEAEPHEQAPAGAPIPEPGPGTLPTLDDAPESLPNPSGSLPARGLVLAALADGPLPGRAVARRAGLRWATTYRLLDELERAGEIVREGKARRSRYRLAGRAR